MDASERTESRLLGVSEAAAFLGVSPNSLRKWSDQELVPMYVTPGGQRRYALEDLKEFRRSMRRPGRPQKRT